MSVIGVYPEAILLGQPGQKGGIRKFSAVEREIAILLKRNPDNYLTTLFDRYGLPPNWPGLEESKRRGTLRDKLEALCEGMRNQVSKKMGRNFRERRFMPYVQYHEIEAFLFVDPNETARVLGDEGLARDIRRVAQKYESVEHIDDNKNTAPSKRITGIFPNYIKGKTVNAHLPRVCAEVGLKQLRRSCPLFHSWLEQLESIASGETVVEG